MLQMFLSSSVPCRKGVAGNKDLIFDSDVQIRDNDFFSAHVKPINPFPLCIPVVL